MKGGGDERGGGGTGDRGGGVEHGKRDKRPRYKTALWLLTATKIVIKNLNTETMINSRLLSRW